MASVIFNTGSAIMNFGNSVVNTAESLLHTAKENKAATALIVLIGITYFRPEMTHAAIDKIADGRHALHGYVDRFTAVVDNGLEWASASVRSAIERAGTFFRSHL